jgi:membrane fusion protein, multidrug efflux system
MATTTIPSVKSSLLRNRPLQFAIVAAVAAGAAYYMWPSHERARARADGAQPVLAADVVAKPVPIQITTIGHVQTIASVSVRSRIDGQIRKVLVHDGQDVNAGDELFELDDRQIRAQLAQAQGTLLKDTAQLRFATQEIDRITPLVATHVASRQQLEQAQANQGALQGTVKADEAQVANFETQLSYTTIRAPIDGRLGTIIQKEGNTIQANNASPLVMLNQMHPIYVTFSVPQSDLARIQAAMEQGPVKVTAVAPDSGLSPETGEVAYIENTIDQASNTLSVKARFNNDDNRLWPGQFVNAVVTIKIEPEALVVPAETVQTGQQGFYVYVIKPDSTVELRNVTIGQTANNETIITKGVFKGEKVVTTGQLRLKNGTKVKINQGDKSEPEAGTGEVATGPGSPS